MGFVVKIMRNRKRLPWLAGYMSTAAQKSKGVLAVAHRPYMYASGLFQAPMKIKGYCVGLLRFRTNKNRGCCAVFDPRFAHSLCTLVTGSRPWNAALLVEVVFPALRQMCKQLGFLRDSKRVYSPCGGCEK